MGINEMKDLNETKDNWQNSMKANNILISNLKDELEKELEDIRRNNDVKRQSDSIEEINREIVTMKEITSKLSQAIDVRRKNPNRLPEIMSQSCVCKSNCLTNRCKCNKEGFKCSKLCSCSCSNN